MRFIILEKIFNPCQLSLYVNYSNTFANKFNRIATHNISPYIIITPQSSSKLISYQHSYKRYNMAIYSMAFTDLYEAFARSNQQYFKPFNILYFFIKSCCKCLTLLQGHSCQILISMRCAYYRRIYRSVDAIALLIASYGTSVHHSSLT